MKHQGSPVCNSLKNDLKQIVYFLSFDGFDIIFRNVEINFGRVYLWSVLFRGKIQVTRLRTRGQQQKGESTEARLARQTIHTIQPLYDYDAAHH